MEDGLKAQMSDRSAKTVAEVLEQSFEEYRVNQGEFLATKQDWADLRTELKGEMSTLRSEFHVSAANLRTEIAGVRSEMIKWMFIFWIGQIGATVTFLLALR